MLAIQDLDETSGSCTRAAFKFLQVARSERPSARHVIYSHRRARARQLARNERVISPMTSIGRLRYAHAERKQVAGAMSVWQRAAAILTGFVAIALLATGPATASTADLAVLPDTPPANPSVADAVGCRVAIEEVLWNHRIWPAENADPKPAFDAAAAAAAIEPRVEDALRQSNALAKLYGQSVTSEMLQAELDRMAK